MRSTIFAASALCGLTAALPQMINIEAALAVPTPTAGLGPEIEIATPLPISYNQAAATKSAAAAVATGGIETDALKKRDFNDDCALQPDGLGHVPGDGSVGAYTDEEGDLRKAARNAGIPAGYVKSFTDATGSTEQIGYLTYKVIADGSYNVQQCADFCDSEKFCLGFNIFFERDPKYKPAPSCPTSEPITNVKCSIYGYPVAKGSATNTGQGREQFEVVVAGSNGYSKLAPTCKAAPAVQKFNAPENLQAAIFAPYIQKNGQNYDTYNGMRLFNEGPFDPSLCAAACDAQTAFDRQHLADANGDYKPCNFFTAYILTKNEIPLGTYCALYTQSWPSSYATNTGYWAGDDAFKVVCAASYTATTLDDGNKNNDAPY